MIKVLRITEDEMDCYEDWLSMDAGRRFVMNGCTHVLIDGQILEASNLGPAEEGDGYFVCLGEDVTTEMHRTECCCFDDDGNQLNSCSECPR